VEELHPSVLAHADVAFGGRLIGEQRLWGLFGQLPPERGPS
jgi:hypothetical protein